MKTKLEISQAEMKAAQKEMKLEVSEIKTA